MSDTNGRAGATPPKLQELMTLRTDFEDVPVPQLGGTELRLYALTGTARAVLVSEMTGLQARHTKAGTDPDDDPATVQAVMEFQGRVVAASLGYPLDEWDQLGATIGAPAVELLYEKASALSGIDKKDQDKATDRLPPTRKAASGTA